MEEKEFGTVERCDRSGVSESVELERGRTVGRLTDIFLSQILMLTDWDVLMLQECFRKLDGVNVAAHELFTPSELLARQSSSIREKVRTIEDCWRVRQDGLRSSGVAS